MGLDEDLLFGHFFKDGSLIRESAGLGRVFFVEGEGPIFGRFLFEWIVTWYQRNHQKDVMFSHTHKYWYHSMRCLWCFQRMKHQHQIFRCSRWRCTKVFSTHFYWVFGYLRCPKIAPLGLDCWVGCQVAGAAALLFSWLRSATNTVKSVEDWGWKGRVPGFQVCCYEKSWTLCFVGWGHEVGSRRDRNKLKHRQHEQWTLV